MAEEQKGEAVAWKACMVMISHEHLVLCLAYYKARM